MRPRAIPTDYRRKSLLYRVNEENKAMHQDFRNTVEEELYALKP